MHTDDKTAKIIFLGTGTAMPQHSFNTCYVVDSGSGTRAGRILVDTGGGNGILRALAHADLTVADIGNMILSHAHTDHILGAVWVVRYAIYDFKRGILSDRLHIYGNHATLSALRTICALTFLPSYMDDIDRSVAFHEVSPGDTATIGGMRTRFFDCHSGETEQIGFTLTLPSGRTLCCMGDESIKADNAAEAGGADTLVCGAFCLKADAHIFHPYEKHHLTVADVAATAAQADISHLILVHCEDSDLATRSTRYRHEAQVHFPGRVDIPTDGAVLLL